MGPADDEDKTIRRRSELVRDLSRGMWKWLIDRQSPRATMRACVPLLTLAAIFVTCYLIYATGLPVTEKVGTLFENSTVPTTVPIEDLRRVRHIAEIQLGNAVIFWEGSVAASIAWNVFLLGFAVETIREVQRCLKPVSFGLVGCTVIILSGAALLAILGGDIGPAEITRAVTKVTTDSTFRRGIYAASDQSLIPGVVTASNVLSFITLIACAIALGAIVHSSSVELIVQSDANASTARQRQERVAFLARLRAVARHVVTTRKITGFLLVAAMLGGLTSHAYFRIGAMTVTGDDLNRLLSFSLSLGILFTIGCTLIIVGLYASTIAILSSAMSSSYPTSIPPTVRTRLMRRYGLTGAFVDRLLFGMAATAPTIVAGLATKLVNHLTGST